MEQKIIGYNLNELGEKHKDAIEIILASSGIKYIDWSDVKNENGCGFEAKSEIHEVMNKHSILEVFTTPVYEQPKYKEGEWVYMEFKTHTAVAKIKDVRGEKFFYSCNIHNDGTVWTDDFYVDEKDDRTKGIATEEQKLQHFSAAARKKGFVDGVIVKTVGFITGDYLETIVDDNYFIGGKMLWGNGEIYNFPIFNFNTLQWAEIVQPKEESYITSNSENVQIKTDEQMRLDKIEESIREIRKHLNL